MSTATRAKTMALLSLFLLAMFAPLSSPVRVAGVTVAGPDIACAQQIECFDDEGNYIPCPPEPPHPPGGGGGGGGGGENGGCNWEAWATSCATCASRVPFWIRVAACIRCAYHTVRCAVS